MPVLLTEYHKYKVCLELFYMQHMHMVCGELHICHELVLHQTVNDNAYSTPLLHEALDVNNKIVIMGIGWYHNTFHIFICNISIILNMILSIYQFYFTGSFPVLDLINGFMFTMPPWKDVL